MGDGTTSKAVEPEEAAAASGEEENSKTPETQGEAAAEQKATGAEGPDGSPGASEKSVEKAEEGEDKGPKKLTAQEQVRQAVNGKNKPKPGPAERDRELAELEQQMPEKPAFKEYTEKDLKEISDRLGALKQEIKGLESSGNHLEAGVKSGEYSRLVAEYNQNTRLQAEHEVKTQTAQRRQQAVNAELSRFDEAAAIFVKHRNIPQETFDALSLQFFEACNNDPVLGREFADMAQRQGPMATVRWAYEKMSEINRKRADEEFRKRNGAKDNTVAGITQSGKTEGLKQPKTYDELMKLKPAQRNQIFKTNRTLWKKLCAQTA